MENNVATYKTEDGIIVKTENAKDHWDEATRFDGSNQISVPTGSQWHHQTLYQSRKGRYWIEATGNMQGYLDHAEMIGDREAAVWLMENGHQLPEDLQHFEDEVAE